MDRSQPWSVKGIEPETRQAAKMAARRAGLTLGAWLNQVIRHAAAEDAAGGAAPRGPTAEPLPLMPHAPTAAAQVPPGQYGPPEHYAQRVHAGGPADGQAGMETLLEALRRQTEEIKAAIRESTGELRAGTDRIPPLADRLHPLGDQIEMIAARLEQVGDIDRRLTEAEHKAEQASLQVRPLERSLSRLSERLEGTGHMPYPDPEGRYRRRGLFGKLFGEN